MVNAEGKPKPYSQLAAIQMGSLWTGQALVWKPGETAGNGTDLGCFEVDLAKWQPVVKELAKTVFSIKGRGDKRGAEALRDMYVSDKTQEWSKLRGVIQERWLRSPKASFVYAITP